MTLLVSVFAAIISTVLWYKNAPKNEMKLGILCWLFWGASLMWLVDAIFEYAELREAYFTPEPADMLNDFFLGISVVALGLVIWVVILLVKDPKGAVKKVLLKK
jgi:multisubunit Na+/H+ antiporter MnhB subunit